MPTDPPAKDTDFVDDQTKVVALSAPDLSYEPLDSFRAANARRAEARLKANVVAPLSATAPGDAAAAEGGFWTRVGIKTLTGGAAPAGDATAPSSDEAAADGDVDSAAASGGDGEEDDWDDDEWEEDDSGEE